MSSPQRAASARIPTLWSDSGSARTKAQNGRVEGSGEPELAEFHCFGNAGGLHAINSWAN
eukprot:10178468-Alexandrium_andersonii.AAC.1